MCITSRFALSLAPVLLPAGCSSQYYTSQIREDGPSAEVVWNSPTASDLQQRFEPAVERRRDFVPQTLTTADGVVPHWPLYFEDPLVTEGAGREDADPTGITASGRNKYHWGYTDLFAFGYSPARFMLNTFGLPVSMVVRHPFTEMESDGRVSRQWLGYDHDATNASQETQERALNDLGPRLYADESASASNDPHRTLDRKAPRAARTPRVQGASPAVQSPRAPDDKAAAAPGVMQPAR